MFRYFSLHPPKITLDQVSCSVFGNASSYLSRPKVIEKQGSTLRGCPHIVVSDVQPNRTGGARSESKVFNFLIKIKNNKSKFENKSFCRFFLGPRDRDLKQGTGANERKLFFQKNVIIIESFF